MFVELLQERPPVTSTGRTLTAVNTISSCVCVYVCTHPEMTVQWFYLSSFFVLL